MPDTAALREDREALGARRSWLRRGVAACCLGAGLYAGLAVTTGIAAHAEETSATATQSEETTAEPATTEEPAADQPAAPESAPPPTETTDPPAEGATTADPAAAEQPPVTDPAAGTTPDSASAPDTAPAATTSTTTTTTTTTVAGSTTTTTVGTATEDAGAPCGSTATRPADPGTIAGDDSGATGTPPCPAPVAATPAVGTLAPVAPQATTCRLPLAPQGADTVRAQDDTQTVATRAPSPHADAVGSATPVATLTAAPVAGDTAPAGPPSTDLPAEQDSPLGVFAGCGASGPAQGPERGPLSPTAAVLGSPLEISLALSEVGLTAPAAGSPAITATDPATRPD